MTPLSLGIAYSSGALPGLHASLTYYTLDISNYINTPPLQTVLDNPDLFPGAVIRAPPTSGGPEPRVYLGQITSINDLYFNFGDLHLAGVDADLAYEIDTGFGHFRPSVAVSNVFKWRSALTPDAPSINYVSQGNLVGPGWAPRWKGTVALAWTRGLLSANLSGRYIGRYTDYQLYFPNMNEHGNVWEFDGNLRYEIGKAFARSDRWMSGTYIAAGVINLSRSPPPPLSLWNLSVRSSGIVTFGGELYIYRRESNGDPQKRRYV